MSTVQLIGSSEGVCLLSDQKVIHFMRYHFVVSHQEKEYTFYLYKYMKTQNWFVHHISFDQCLSSSGWSKTIHNAFKRQRSVVNPRGINQHYIDAFTIPMEAEEEIVRCVEREKKRNEKEEKGEKEEKEEKKED